MQIGEIANVDACSQAMEDVLDWTTVTRHSAG
jgi:hypothetical protein